MNIQPEVKSSREKFLEALYEHCSGRLEMRGIAKPKPDRREFCAPGDYEAVNAFCQRFPDYNIYFGVGTRDESGSGRKENVREIPALWVDDDFKSTSPSEVKALLDKFPFCPSAAILTGHGVHFYWILKEPALSTEFDRVEDLLRRIRSAMRGDPAACEVARVLRVPGTMNVKEAPVPVRVHFLKPHRYCLDDFEILPQPKSNGHTNTCLNPPGWMVEAFRGVPEGGNKHFAGRDAAGVKVAGYFIDKLPESDVSYLLRCWNIRNSPPLEDEDLKRIINSVLRYKNQNGEQRQKRFRTASIAIPTE